MTKDNNNNKKNLFVKRKNPEQVNSLALEHHNYSKQAQT